MHVVICSIELFLPGAVSLKDKRHSIKSITQRIRARVNASASETGFLDSWQRSEIGVAMVSSDKVMLDRQISIIRRIVDDCAEVETAKFLVEYV